MNADEALVDLVSLVNKIRALQGVDGCVDLSCGIATPLVIALRDRLNMYRESLKASSLIDAIVCDLDMWMRAGLNSKPYFDNTLNSFSVPQDGGRMFLMAPVRATNGPSPEGYHLELVSGIRRESRYLSEASEFTDGYIAPFQCIDLGVSSTGFSDGNCIVLFPESVLSYGGVDRQGFAMFFFSKFRDIFFGQTLPEVVRIFGHASKFLFGGLKSSFLSEQDLYDARCLWGYYHDYMHHTGPRPLDKNLYIKMNWYAGLLEEAKVDLKVFLMLVGRRPRFWMEISEFILMDRMFRYPIDVAKRMTFDAGTGVFIFDAFFKRGAIKKVGCNIEVDMDALVEAAVDVVVEIERLERLPDDEYLGAAKSYVLSLLGESSDKSVKFKLDSTEYHRVVLGRAK